MTRHFLSGEELTGEELTQLLARAIELKADRHASSALEGKTAAIIFQQPSTRTRVSVETGIVQLGGYPLILREGEMQLARGESVRDTALVLSRYVDLIGIRAVDHDAVVELSQHSTVPVFNLLTARHHPCQALADLMTLLERFGRLAGLTLAYLGDGNNVANSLMLIGALAGVNVTIGTPREFAPDAEVVGRAVSIAGDSAQIRVTEDPTDAVTGADAVYTDVWVSMGAGDADRRKEVLKPFQLNRAVMQAAGPQALALHCLPAHVGEEITEDVLYGPQSAVFDQAENRLHVQKALFEFLVK